MGVNSTSVFSRTVIGLQVVSIPFLPLLLATSSVIKFNIHGFNYAQESSMVYSISDFNFANILNGPCHRMYDIVLKAMNF